MPHEDDIRAAGIAGVRCGKRLNFGQCVDAKLLCVFDDNRHGNTVFALLLENSPECCISPN
jgi:hypothetical protein